jgi:hypothetical protein
MVGKYHDTVRYPKLTKDIKTWVLSASEVQTNSIYANTNGQYRFPFSSPIGDLLTLDHINVNGGMYQGQPTDSISWLLLLNHTAYVYIRSFLEANELVALHRTHSQALVPKEILTALDFISYVFTKQNWKREIVKEKPILDNVFKKIGQKVDSEIDRNYEANIGSRK